MAKDMTKGRIMPQMTAFAIPLILGNLFQIFEVHLPGRMIFLAIYGLFGGIFVGCWAMALAEILNVFPIFMRRARIVRYLAVFVLMVALGKGIGAGLFFWKRW